MDRAHFSSVKFILILLSLTATALGQGARSYKSGPIQITADGAWVWTANQHHDSVSRLNTATTAVDEYVLPAPDGPHSPRGVAVLEDGSDVWVACHDSDRVYVLNGANGAVLADIPLPWGSGPWSVALSRDQSLALVTLHRASSVAVIDVSTHQLSEILAPMFHAPFGIAFLEDGDTAWITHLFSDEEHSRISRIDVSGPSALVKTRVTAFATDPRSSSALAPPFDIAEGGYLTFRGHLAQIPGPSNDGRVWLPTQYHNITESIYSPDSTMQAVIRQLDIVDRNVPNANADKIILTAVHVHDPTNNNAYLGPGWDARISGPVDIAFNTDGSVAYMLNELSNDVIVVPTDTPAVKPGGASPLTEIPVGDQPNGIAVSPVAAVAYVYNLLSRDVSIIDLNSETETARIDITPTTSEPFGPTFLTGAKIFSTSDDPRVSSNDKVACASCHIHGEHESRTWNFHNLPGQHGPRESTSLLGLGLTFGAVDPTTGWGQLHRSGDRDEVQDFEHTFQGVTMGGTGFLGGAVNPELGAPNAGLDADLDALAHYLLNLDPIMRSPHRAADGALTEAAVRGATFFAGTDNNSFPADSGCIACHVPATGFADLQFHDVGSRRPSQEQELNNRSPAWHVNTPTLVGVWTSPPYNGVSGWAGTIFDVLLDQAARADSSLPHGTPDGLLGRQMEDLKEFILSIDGNMTPSEVIDARDTAPPRIVRVEPVSKTTLVAWFNEAVDESSVENTANWRVVEGGTVDLPVLGAVWDDIDGDRVTITTTMQAGGNYELIPNGPIMDLAGMASNNTANAMDLGDPANTHAFSIGSSLTITLGASGHEHIRIPVHDCAMIGPGLQTWSHDRVMTFEVNPNPGVTTGFVRFEWQNGFTAVTGVDDPAEILAASVSLSPEEGDSMTYTVRRCLQPWSDPVSGGDWNSNPVGAPTWRDHQHPNNDWNQNGAGALGGTGGSVSDYNGNFDLAATVDASPTLVALTERLVIDGPMVTDAFRFWFDNPQVDYGYGIRLSTSDNVTKFHRWESELGQEGPVLTITYDLGCVETGECNDNDACTHDACGASLCSNTPGPYGDVDGSGVVDVDDTVCVLDGFSGSFSMCSLTNVDLVPCAGNGGVDLMDILGVIDAGMGIDACGCGG